MKASDLRPMVLLPTPGRVNRHVPPHGYGSLELDHEQAAHLNKLAIETFMEMANKGLPFADCLASVLLTGMNFARETLTGTNVCGESASQPPPETSK